MAGELEQVMTAIAAAATNSGGRSSSGIRAPSYQAYLPSQATQSLNVQMSTNPYAMGHWYGAQSRDRLNQLDYSQDLAQSNQLAAALAKQKLASEADSAQLETLLKYGHQYPGVTWGTVAGSHEGGMSTLNPHVQQAHVLGTALQRASGMKDLGDANKNGITPGEPTSKALGAIKVGPVQQNKGDGSSGAPKYTITSAFPLNGAVNTVRGVGTDPSAVSQGVSDQVTAIRGANPSRTSESSQYSPTARTIIDNIKMQANRSDGKAQVVDAPDGAGGAILQITDNGQSYQLHIDKDGKQIRSE